MPFLAPIVSAVAGFVSGTLAAGGIGAFALRLGGSLLLSAASKALAKKPKPATGEATAGRTVTAREAVAPRDLVYGRARKGGTIIFLHSRGVNNEFLEVVILLAANRVRKIGNIYFDGVLAIPDGSTTSVGTWASVAGVERALGGDDQLAFTALIAAAPGLWTADHRLRGCAAIHLSLTVSAEAYPSGIPNVTADIEGKDDILDPRTGTRGYSENAALCLADYMSLSSYGIGAQIAAEDGIRSATLIAAANVCDEAVTLSGGGTEPRYTCNGVVSLDQSPQDIVEQMLTAMAGNVAWSAGQWDIFAGAWRAPTVTLTADDVRDGGVSVATRVARAENFNAVRGTFVSPENDWQADDFPAYASSVYLAEDGGERIWRDIVLPFTISASTAQRLAKIALERQRRQSTVRFAGKLKAWQLAVGDVAMFTYARWGMSAKPFDVVSVNLDLQQDGDGALLVPELVLRETSSLVYDWAASEAQIYAAAPRSTLPSAFDIAPPGSPEVREEVYVTRAGDGVKALARITWAAAESAFVAQYEVQARLESGAWSGLGGTAGLSIEQNDIAPGMWEWRVRAVSLTGVPSVWRSVARQIYGLSAPPLALAGASLQTAGGSAILKWAQSADPDVRIGGNIVIRHSEAIPPTWANSTSMDEVPGASAVAVVPLKPGAYILRSRDSGGQLGPEIILQSSGAQALDFAAVTSLTEDSTFTGTKTGTVVYAGALTLSSQQLVSAWASVSGLASVAWGGGVIPVGTYTFDSGIDLGSVRPVRLRSQIVLESFAVNDMISTRTTLISKWSSINGAEGADVDCTVEIQTTPDNPAGSPVWSTWSRVDATEVKARGLRARATLKSADPLYAPLVQQLRLYVDEVA